MHAQAKIANCSFGVACPVGVLQAFACRGCKSRIVVKGVVVRWCHRLASVPLSRCSVPMARAAVARSNAACRRLALQRKKRRHGLETVAVSQTKKGKSRPEYQLVRA